MSYLEWERTRIHPGDVIKYLKKALCSQNNLPERDVIELVKSGDMLRLKGRSDKTKAHLKKTMQTTEMDISRID